MSEEKRIMDILGRQETEGEVRGSHLGKVLTYLKTVKSEAWDITMSKLALILGVNPRYIRENYLKGLMYFGVIKLYRNTNTLNWQWVGESALTGAVIPSESEQVMNKLQDIEKEETKKETKKEEKPKEGYCPSCGKKLKKDQKFCNEKCVTEYYMKKKKEKK